MIKGSKQTTEAKRKISESQKRRLLIQSIGYKKENGNRYLLWDGMKLPIRKQRFWEGWFRRG